MQQARNCSGYFLLLFSFFLFSLSANAQRSFGGQPLSFLLNKSEGELSSPLQAEKMPAFNLTKVKSEDKEAGGTSRFAAP
ncbi:MAG: hypothetical protein AAFO94_07750, partial [Bacteroidota bacterium]